MPKGIDGIQLARKTRELHPNIRIVLASGYALPALTEQHGNLDEFTFIIKPYRLTELVQRCAWRPNVDRSALTPEKNQIWLRSRSRMRPQGATDFSR